MERENVGEPKLQRARSTICRNIIGYPCTPHPPTVSCLEVASHDDFTWHLYQLYTLSLTSGSP